MPPPDPHDERPGSGDDHADRVRASTSDLAPHVVVIGGGITGLTTAWALTRPDLARDRSARILRPRVTVLEAADRLGGKIQTTEFAGMAMDTGPDAFLTRVPWALHLCQELGIENELTAPADSRAWLWSRGQMHRFPEKTVLGVPSDLRSLARSRVVHSRAVARAALDLTMPATIGRDPHDDDPTIGRVLGARLGQEIVDRLVDPLLGGINGGSVRNLSLASAAPQVADLAGRGSSIIRGAQEQLRRRDPEHVGRPVFNAPTGGMSRIVDALVARLGASGAIVQTNAEVTGLRRSGNGWLVEMAGGRPPIAADTVVVTTPAHAAASLLKEVCPDAVPTLGSISYASVAMVRLAFDRESLGRPLTGTGFVVPAVDGGLMTACSWATAKWRHLVKDDRFVLRASAGRLDDHRAEQLSDDELVSQIRKELTESMSISRAPIEVDVTRWDDSFPQYTPGHAQRVLQIEQAVNQVPGLAVAGAAYHGLGIPACVKNATDTAEQLLARLARH